MKSPSLPHDKLFHVERRIAQRADELSRLHGVDRGHALDHWRQAEAEVLGAIWPEASASVRDSESWRDASELLAH